MRIGVVGNGVVGHATARVFVEHAEVRVYDTLAERRIHPLFEVLDCSVIFICLPTPQSKDGLACDLSAVEAFFASVKGSRANFVLRSTCPIGTTRRLGERYGLTNLVHSPEFLTARTAVTDAQIPARNIIGWPNGLTPEGCDAINKGASSRKHPLLDLYERRFPGVPVHVMSSDESEAVKLFLNGFFATKIAYFNEVYTLSERLGLDWGRVLAGVLSDGRIAHAHTRVPGPDGRRGYGGSCLPKDAASLVHQLEGHGLRADVTRGAVERNKADRGTPE